MDEDCFIQIGAFFIEAPDEYDHEKYLIQMQERFCQSDRDVITNKDFASGVKIRPGQRFLVEVFTVMKDKTATIRQCLAKIKEEEGVLVGVQGLILALEKVEDSFPFDFIAFLCEEKKDSLEYHRLLCFYKYSGMPYFTLKNSNEGLKGNQCLLCFCPY